MFQYAFAKSVANKFNSKIVLDISCFKNPFKNRTYKLSSFNIFEEILSDSIIEQLPDEINLLKEDITLVYNGNMIKSIELPCYLVGYWQSWKYFDSVNRSIRSDFMFKRECFILKSN